MIHFQLIGGWVYVSCRKCYQEFMRHGCRAVFISDGVVGMYN